MPFIQRMILILICVILSSCGKTLVGTNPETAPEENFQILWEDFDKLYPSFEIKNADWNALYNTYRPQITPQTSEIELFNTMTALLSHLDDGHVALITPFASSYADQKRREQYKNPNLFQIVKNTYLNNQQTIVSGGDIVFGKISDTIGYIRIVSFLHPHQFDDIDLAIEALKNMEGIIVDTRNNSGGSNSHLIAGRFADQERLFVYTQRRNGPKHTDVEPKEAWYVTPRGPIQFTKKVALLTNRFSASETEWFRLSMSEFPNVTAFGDTTIGDMAHNLYRTLPNGWNYRLSIAKVSASDGTIYEGTGIPPDVSISHPQNINHDPVIDTAILFLKNQ